MVLLIAGIDPGTTTAFAAVDLNGRLIKADSSKNFDLNKIISNIVLIGRPIAVGRQKECPFHDREICSSVWHKNNFS